MMMMEKEMEKREEKSFHPIRKLRSSSSSVRVELLKPSGVEFLKKPKKDNCAEKKLNKKFVKEVTTRKKGKILRKLK